MRTRAVVTARLAAVTVAALVAVLAASLGAIRPAVAEPVPSITFREATESWGVDFTHHHGGSGERYMVETMVGGVVIFDFDADGDDDLFFVDGAALPGYEGEPPGSKLLRNEGGRFVDHTERSGITFAGYGCGAVAADYDGDGDMDLYITAFGDNALWENLGDGTFTDATARAGIGEPLWSAGAVFADFDLDGDLDLYVANYVDFSLDKNKFCGKKEENLPGYCSPVEYEGLADRYFRNQGDGTFVDATAEAGFEGPRLAGLGVVAGDLDDDGWPDLYVANDTDPNLLFHNQGGGVFEDISLLSGTSYGEAGNPEAGMGTDFGDVDGDGRLDIVVTNFELETHALYKNLGSTLFTDARYVSAIAEPSLRELAFGVDFADLDNDADLDLFIANGHILDNAELFTENSRYAQKDQVMENLGTGVFRLVEEPGFDNVDVGRGLATSDLDRDGDIDVVVINSNTAATLYENVTAAPGSRIDLDLAGTGGNRLGIGARAIIRSGERTQLDEVRSSSSYLSQNATTLHFGLGTPPDDKPVEVEVRWPQGERQRWHLPADVRVQLVRR